MATLEETRQLLLPRNSVNLEYLGASLVKL